MTWRFPLLCVVLVVFGHAQEFEAASIKPAAPSDRRGGRATSSGDRYTYSNTTLMNVLTIASRLKAYQVEGPEWIKSERYDIVAKAPDNTPKDQIPLMLLSVLMERFQLKLHRDQREMPVYALVIGKGAPKYQKSEGELGYGMSNGRREFKNYTMVQLADFIAFGAGRPVFDRTGLKGTYTFQLEMSLEELGGINAKQEGTAPSIFTIIEGLGLKLESRKEPVEVLIVDSGNKVPSEN